MIERGRMTNSTCVRLLEKKVCACYYDADMKNGNCYAVYFNANDPREML